MPQAILLNTERLRTALSDLETSNKELLIKQRLLTLIEQELQFINGDTGEAMTVLVYEWRSLSEEKQNDLLLLRGIYEQIWLDVIGECFDAGLITTQPFLFRRLLTGSVSWTVNWYKEKTSLKELAKSILDTFVTKP